MKTLTLYLRYWAIRSIFILFFILISFGCYFFSVQKVSIFSNHLTNPYYLDTEDLPRWLYGVEYLCFVFIFCSILFFIMILLYKSYKNKRDNTRKKYKDLFAISLSDYLYSDQQFSDEEKAIKIKDFRKMMKDDYSKRIFINTLRQAMNLTRGPVRDLSIKIFYAFEFNSFIYGYLHGPYIKKKIFALKVISDFKMEGYEKYIIKLTQQQSNYILHSEALVTLINISKENNLLFLTENNIKLSLWDINTIINTLDDVLRFKLISIITLIESEEPEISALGIILARLDKRVELKETIRGKIGNTNEMVNEEACITFTSFAEDQTDYDFMIHSFGIASEKAQQAIVNSIGRCPDKNIAIQFIDYVIENKSLKLKTEALKQLLNIDLSLIKKYQKSDNMLIRQVCLQVLNFHL